ncbi:MAG TPA: alanine racemase, partial [Chryseosolibacter sp.]|nr:alanine racemase [Chryseosolibacter sp.]
GLAPEEITEVLGSDIFRALDHVRVTGLMGMASLTEDEQKIRTEFQGLRNLFETVKRITLPPNAMMSELSMGMSSDYQIAVEEGSTMVRVGSAIFGNRHSNEKI